MVLILVFLIISFLQVGVSIKMSSFNLTRIVTLTPFYTIANKTSFELEVGEVGADGSLPTNKWSYFSSSEVIFKAEFLTFTSLKISEAHLILFDLNARASRPKRSLAWTIRKWQQINEQHILPTRISLFCSGIIIFTL